MKPYHISFALLLMSVAFVTAYFGLSVPDLGAQVTGTIRISVGSRTMSSISFTTAASSTSTSTSSTLTTLNTSILGDGGGSPEFQVGALVLASAIGLALVLFRRGGGWFSRE